VDAFERDREAMAVGQDSEICFDCGEFPCICSQIFDEAEEWDADPESSAT